MAAKFFVLAVLVAAAQGSAIHGDYTSFSYGVSDPHTGDVKSQHETRVGDNVVGQYSLLESDGTRRTVDYAADAHSGFNAIVRKDPALIGHVAHAPAVVAAPVAHAAPAAYAAHAAYAPAAYAARVAPVAVAHAAPVAVAAAPSVSYSAHSTSVAHGGVVAHAAPLAYAAGPLAHGAAYAAPLAHGYGAAYAAPLAHGLGAHGYGAHGYGAHGLGLHYCESMGAIAVRMAKRGSVCVDGKGCSGVAAVGQGRWVGGVRDGSGVGVRDGSSVNGSGVREGCSYNGRSVGYERWVLAHDSAEAVVGVSSVVHRPPGTVRLEQGVLADHVVTDAGLVLALHITGVGSNQLQSEVELNTRTMASKFVVLALLVVAAQGSAIHGANYNSFSYGVSDPHTGDVKSQHETRVGDNVVGQYSLLESDGTRRTVDYAADAHNGFNAVVRKDPALVAHAPAVVAPLTYSAPVAAAYGAHAAPLAYAHAAPVAYAHAAPVAYSAHASPLAYNSYSYAAAPLAHSAIAAPLAYGYGAHGYGAHGYGAHGYARLAWSMAAKVVVLTALVALAHASVVPVAKVDNDYTSFAYDVADPYTGDFKSQVETRSGGVVQGQYSLLDADGTKRTVDYSADDVNGFNAVVRKDPAVIASVAAAPAVVAPAVAPAVVAARTYAAPVVATAPVVASAPAVVASAPAVVATKAIAAPSFYTAAAPSLVATSSFAAPSVYAAAAPAYSYASSAPVIARTYAASAPVFARTYAASVPAISHSYSSSAPVFTSSYAGAPVLARSYAAPALYSAGHSLFAPSAYARYASPYYSTYW
ncbi:uncharacterized protein LOC119830179 [Zerene cesonia]|uniref:uncharacterized protein LOC119830179 n=1 Tax=Zerene cesonia TaxID=33412 RepID=UPI0018E510A4|nr:uncharacterized protein LOC119830179 [Zerene cesonia]